MVCIYLQDAEEQHAEGKEICFPRYVILDRRSGMSCALSLVMEI